MMTVAAVRVLVLFSESASAVRAEREADEPLLELCRQGLGISSEKMRAACLAARSARASPLLLKALTRSMWVAHDDVKQALATPFNAFVAIFFLVSGLLVPALPWARAIGKLTKLRIRRTSSRGGRNGRLALCETDSSSSDDEHDHEMPHVLMVSEDDLSRPSDASSSIITKRRGSASLCDKKTV